MACAIFTDGWLLVILAACRYSSTAIVGEKCAVKLGEKQHSTAIFTKSFPITLLIQNIRISLSRNNSKILNMRL
jgi:uncharacterized UBP type Zn finger protein